MSEDLKKIFGNPVILIVCGLIVVMFIVNIMIRQSIDSSMEIPPSREAVIKPPPVSNPQPQDFPVWQPMGNNESLSGSVRVSSPQKTAIEGGKEKIYEPSIKDELLLQ